ncbi:MAG: flagellar biosynthetic protein FliR [Myxococcaceae bacterium]
MGAAETQALIEALKQDLGIQVNFTQLLLAFALIMARLLPVIILTPFLGGETVPQEVKLGLGIMVGMVLYPVLITQVKEIPVNALYFIALMLKELFIGLTLSFIVGMVFDAANSAGNLVDTLSGTNQAQLMVPSIGQQASLFSNLQVQFSIVVFLTLGGHHIVIETLGNSLTQIPIGEFPKFAHGNWAFFETCLRVFGDLVRIALALASPVLLATFLVDLALGMINRVAPQVQVFFVAMQIKPAVTVLIMVTAIHLILDRVIGEYGVMFRWLRQAIYLLK